MGGSNASVCAVNHIDTSDVFAAKIMWVNRSSEQERARLQREITKLRKKTHPNSDEVEGPATSG